MLFVDEDLDQHATAFLDRIALDPAAGMPRAVLLVRVERLLAQDVAKASSSVRRLSKPLRHESLRQAVLQSAPSSSLGSIANEDRRPVLDDRIRRTSRILVVEDNVVNQTVALATLKKLGLDADLVVDGVEALEALRRRRYDLVLMDCQMPVLDGYDTTR